MKTALTIITLLCPALAHAAPLTQSQQAVANELPRYGFGDVDVTQLTTAQLSHIHVILFSKRSNAQIRGNIGAILGDSLLNSVFGRRN